MLPHPVSTKIPSWMEKVQGRSHMLINTLHLQDSLSDAVSVLSRASFVEDFLTLCRGYSQYLSKIALTTSVVYWPPTWPGCQNRKCTRVNNRSRISEYNLDHGWIEWVRFMMPTRRRWASNYYITQYTGSSISWRQDVVEKASTQQIGPSGPRLSSCSWREDAGLRNMSQRGWAPGPRLSSPGEWERNTVMANRVGVNMLQFCSVFNSLSHTTLSNKVRGIFL